MRVEEIMSTPVVVTREDTLVKHARDLITRKDVNAVPVLREDGEIAGIISVSDLAATHFDDKKVNDIMTKMVHVVLRNNRVVDAAAVMVKHNVHHLVVMEEGKVIGIVSSLDILKTMVD
ncbi:CBS domain-containing protein [Paracrocinitomix mangrovi]|uniref:CBS domain-containing protein n=1 Tax=Paracrocinitomix mangrovi TaxID=2862509 RepID=UPI001C8DE16A|nr:CBS domain-containing protein [Paracrocinitomix mangrovi]UKN00599.1 CBS domain-containing protein [Paracrocinitomix mangrovi]